MPLAGPTPLQDDVGWDDELESDLQADDEDDATPAAENESAITDEEPSQQDEDPPLNLESIFRSRAPQVLFRLRADQSHCVQVIPCHFPGNHDAQEAMRELGETIEALFVWEEGEPDSLTDEERTRLLWGADNVTPQQRAMLLLRLARAPGKKLSLGQGSFKPNERGMERYLSKWIALPDGTPISLRLLFEDPRKQNVPKGADRENYSPELAFIPDFVLVLALQRGLERERREGEIRDDEDWGDLLKEALKELWDVPLTIPNKKQIEGIRRKLERNHVGDFFPNKTTRKRLLEQQEATPE